MILPSIYPVTCHTDFVGAGSTFVAIQGMQSNGLDFVPTAIARGARTIVVDQTCSIPESLSRLMQEQSIVLQRVSNTRQALALLSAQALDYPARHLKIIAVTGTKGKTTTSCMVYNLLKRLGHKTALISSVYNIIDDVVLETQCTTPQPDYLQVFLQACTQRNIEYVVMEVAAQALSLFRVEGLAFDAAIMTNFSQEHGEFYPTMQEYFNAKCSIIQHLKPNAPLIVNQDDPSFANLSYPVIQGFGLHKSSKLSLEVLERHSTKTLIKISYGTISKTVAVPFVGRHNYYNIAGVVTALLALNHTIEAITEHLGDLAAVPGRFECYALPNGATAVIDYASNPASFQSIFSTFADMTRDLIVVFGAGGDRDRTKRPIMGALAAQKARTVILTTDNPRSEDPAMIVQEIQAGVEPQYAHKVIVELDRAKAIEKAYALSNGQSLIALLGKGPDEYQLIKGDKIPFSERTIVQRLGL